VYFILAEVTFCGFKKQQYTAKRPPPNNDWFEKFLIPTLKITITLEQPTLFQSLKGGRCTHV